MTKLFQKKIKTIFKLKMTPHVTMQGDARAVDPMLSSLSPLGTSLLQPQVAILRNISENSVQSYTNETQRLLAQRYNLGPGVHFFDIIFR